MLSNRDDLAPYDVIEGSRSFATLPVQDLSTIVATKQSRKPVKSCVTLRQAIKSSSKRLKAYHKHSTNYSGHSNPGVPHLTDPMRFYLPRVTVDDTRKHYGTFFTTANNVRDSTLLTEFINTFFDLDVTLERGGRRLTGISAVRDELVSCANDHPPDFVVTMRSTTFHKSNDGTSCCQIGATLAGTRLLMSDSLREYARQLAEPSLERNEQTNALSEKLESTSIYEGIGAVGRDLRYKVNRDALKSSSTDTGLGSSSNQRSISVKAHASAEVRAVGSSSAAAGGTREAKMNAKAKAKAVGDATIGHGVEIMPGAYWTVSSTNYLTGVVGTQPFQHVGNLRFDIGKNRRVISISMVSDGDFARSSG